MVEIGSEFHEIDCGVGDGLQLPMDVSDYTYSFSGRTAIEIALKNEPNIHKALVPSYCCESMLQPFKDLGIDIEFFNVYYDNGLKIDLNIDSAIDCVLWCNYFGFDVNMPDFDEFQNRGGIVIEDITHSFFSKKQYHEQSQYLVASLRKWDPILCGGYCASRQNKLKFKPIRVPSEQFLHQKKNAMKLKKEYLSGHVKIEKEDFLKEFQENNEWIRENYSMLDIDGESKFFLQHVDQEFERMIRRKNVKTLYEGLKNSSIKFLFNLEQMDCPLFCPIIFEDGSRDLVKKTLIENEIYCPTHWPKPSLCQSNLYDIELSLVCDHRYNEFDMERIINTICK